MKVNIKPSRKPISTILLSVIIVCSIIAGVIIGKPFLGRVNSNLPIIGITGLFNGTKVNAPNLSTEQVWWGSQDQTAVVADPESLYDYTIKTDSTNCWAINGTTGQIDRIETNASDVIQFAFNNGYNIAFAPGTYNLQTSISPRSSSTLTGSGPTSMLNMSDQTLRTPIMILNNTNNVKILSLGFNHNIHEIPHSTKKVIDTQDLQANNCTNLEIGYDYFTASGDYCVSIGANQTNPNWQTTAFHPCYNVFYHNNLLYDSRSDGLDIMGGNAFVITNNIFNLTGDDMVAFHGFGNYSMSDMTVSGNVFENMNAYAIKFSNDGYQTLASDMMTNVNIYGNTIDTGVGGCVVNVATLFGAVTIPSNTIFVSNFTFSNNIVKGITNNPGFAAELYSSGAIISNLVVIGNVFSYCGTTGGHDGADLCYCMNSIFSGNTLANCGIASQAVIFLNRSTLCTVSGNSISYTSNEGIYDNSGTDNTIANNVIVNCNATGLWLNGTTNDLVTSNFINGSGYPTGSAHIGDGILDWGNNDTILTNKALSNSRYGINVHAGANYTVVEENDVRGGGATATINAAGNSQSIHRNQGYTTEAAGSVVNTTVTTFSIPHGLAGAPSYGHGGVWCSFNSTQVTNYTWTANSTTITVTVYGTNLEAEIACYWNAEYVP